MNAIRNYCWFGLLLSLLPGVAGAASEAPGNIVGKFFVSSITGNVICVTDGRVLPLRKGDTLVARGVVIETAAGAKAALVFSNQTTLVVDENTRFTIEKFDQEFFPPNNNLRIEPSPSSTVVDLAEGRVLVSTPRLRSGTTMTYRTAHASIGIRGEKVAIAATGKQTHVLVIEGAATVDSRNLAGPSALIAQRLVTGEEAFASHQSFIPRAPDLPSATDGFPLPSTPVSVAKVSHRPPTLSNPETGVTVTLDTDRIRISTRAGTTYDIANGTVAVTPARGAAAAPTPLPQALGTHPEFATLVRAALSAVCTGVDHTPAGLPPESATLLLARVAALAITADPEQAAQFTTQVVAAIGAPTAATVGNSPAATAVVVEALIAAAPASASKIAAAAALAAPADAVTIAAAAARAAPSQAAQIAFAVTHALMVNPSSSRGPGPALQTAAAIAAAVTTSVPRQAGPIAASVLQALDQPDSLGAPRADTGKLTTIAAAVAAAAPSEATALVTALMSTLKPRLAATSADGAAQIVAALGATVSSIVPAQTGEIAATLMQSFLSNAPNTSADTLASTSGVVAAALSKAAPAQTSAVNLSIATATNQSLASVQASSARSTALATQIGQQIADSVQGASFAMQQSNAAARSIAVGQSLVAPSGTPATSPLSRGAPVAATSSTAAPNPTAVSSNAAPIHVTRFTPAELASLATDLEAAQAVQSSVQFTTEPTGNGTFTVQPSPTTPPSLPVEFVTSPANGAG